jgi:hypothetical protein
MLRIADVTSADVLYDLGSGDGRIVIAAARQFGARGTGVDIDPQRISEAQANALQAEVTDRVRFLQQDLFETDLRDATVVTLYLLPKINLKLRPILLRDLRPGTRVVSHTFDMDDWRPDRVSQVSGRNVYFWVVPAQVAGSWRWTLPGATGEQPYTLRLNQQFQKVNGTLRTKGMEVSLANMELVGDHLRFTAIPKIRIRAAPMQFEGRVHGDIITGHVARGAAARGRELWLARREPADGFLQVTLPGR